MELTFDLNVILSGLIIILLGAAVKGIFAIRDEVSKVGKQVVKLETWSVDHDKQDDERYEHLLSEIAGRRLRREPH